MFSWTEYRPFKQGLQTVLSPLESEVMDIMWKEKRATARHIYNRLKLKHSINRTTVNATMNALAKHGLLGNKISKGRGGLKYIYYVRCSRSKFSRQVVDKVLDSLFEAYGRTTKKCMRAKLKRV